MSFCRLTYVRVTRIAVAAVVLLGTTFAEAARSRDCEGGGWLLTQQGSIMLVRGTHVHFDLDLRTMAVLNWTLTGAPNPGRLVDRPTVIFASKTPLHGVVLTQTERLRNDGGDLVFTRTNGDVSVKIQAKDCSQGGVFQMEVEADSVDSIRVRHVLAPEVFYFDNPNFREREGDVVPFTNAAGESQDIVISPRINFASDTSEDLVGRDSPQAATRIPHPTCTNQIPKRDGGTATVQHCGGVSEWDVLSGGAHGPGDGRRFHGGGTTRDLLRQGLSGAEPGPRRRRRARPSVPGPSSVPTESSNSVVALTAEFARVRPRSPSWLHIAASLGLARSY
jgi:hypothetical protein